MLTVKTITYNSLTTVYDSLLAKHSIDATIIKNCTQYSHTEYSNFEPLVSNRLLAKPEGSACCLGIATSTCTICMYTYSFVSVSKTPMRYDTRLVFFFVMEVVSPEP